VLSLVMLLSKFIEPAGMSTCEYPSPGRYGQSELDLSTVNYRCEYASADGMSINDPSGH
jgi:hypothetical protein